MSPSRARRIGLAAALALAAAGAGRAERIGVVLTKALKSLEAAAAAIEAEPDVRVTRYDLSRGTTEVDRIIGDIRKNRLDSLVALGAPAHELLAAQSQGLPFVSAMTGSKDAGARGVSDLPPATEWAEVLAEVLPRGSKVATIDSGGSLGEYLAALGAELRARGLALEVHRVPAGKGVTSIAQDVMGSCRGFFFPRTGELMNKAAAVAVLKASNKSRVPIFAFSPALVKAGALLSLEVDDAEIGRRAVAKLRGRPAPAGRGRVRLSAERAKVLGLSIPASLQARAGK